MATHMENYFDRGLRQGHPILPYLFIICAEALSAMLQNAERDGGLSWVPIARGRMKLNHLFFAEDNFLFCKANVSEWCHLPQVIDTYEQASGQKLNKKKASIFVSRSTSAANI